MDKKPFIFSTLCIGTEYFKTYLVPLLLSFVDVYPDKHIFLVCYNDIDDKLIELAKKLLNDRVIFRKIKENYLQNSSYVEKAAFKISLSWNNVINEFNNRKIILMDSDMIICKPIDDIFTDDFDIGYTYFDNQEVPWTTSHRVSYTKNGYPRINTGILLVNNSEKCQLFFEIFKKTTIKFIDTKNKLCDEFKSAEQGSLPYLMTNGKIGKFNENFCHTINESYNLKFKGFPCEILNHSESTCDGKIQTNTRILHYKWSWREILPLGCFKEKGPTLLKWNLEKYGLWKKYYNKWEKYYNK